MAAGEGTRLRPLTERWPKPVLPIDGRPVLATLLRELAAAELRRVWLVTGHLAEQVERLAGDGSGFGVEVRSVRQPAPLGSADAVQRALAAGAAGPLIVTAADTLFHRGDVARFADEFTAAQADGAVAVRTDPSAERRTPRDPAWRWARAGHERRGPGEPMVGRATLGNRPWGGETARPRPASLRAREGLPVGDRRRPYGYRGRDREDSRFDVSA